jgi:mannose-6-phosphate isomerase-like protein (cupin superfamily)
MPPKHPIVSRLVHGPSSIRNLEQQTEFRSICGFRKDLVMAPEEGVAIHLMRIQDSKKHYHKITTEYYYVTEGEGELELDGEIYPIQAGDLVVIKPGTVHTSRPLEGKELKVLITVAPNPDSLPAPDLYYKEQD